jgi:hypothetical protein
MDHQREILRLPFEFDDAELHRLLDEMQRTFCGVKLVLREEQKDNGDDNEDD